MSRLRETLERSLPPCVTAEQSAEIEDHLMRMLVDPSDAEIEAAAIAIFGRATVLGRTRAESALCAARRVLTRRVAEAEGTT